MAAAKKLTTGKVKGLFLGNDGGAGLMGGPMLWSAGLDYLTREGDSSASTTPRPRRHSASCARCTPPRSLLLGAPKDWFDPSTPSPRA